VFTETSSGIFLNWSRVEGRSIERGLGADDAFVAENLRRPTSEMDAIIILPLPPAGDNKDKIHFRVLHDAQIFCSAKRLYFFATRLRFRLYRKS
jgi:hypothetical protein